MKKLSIIIALLSGIVLFPGCTEEEIPLYSFDEEGINFWVETSSSTSSSLLTKTINLNVYANNNSATYEGEKLDISVRTQGRTRDFDRKYTIKIGEILEGIGITLPQTEFTIPANEGRTEASIFFALDDGMVPRGKMSKFTIVFDYDKCDFVPGVIQREKMTVTIDNRWTLASVNLSQSSWDTYFGPGYGPYSGAKIGFIYENFGRFNFSAYLPWYTDGASFTNLLKKLQDALEEYKANSAQDPVAYPPLYDEVKGGNTWISFP